MADDGLRLAYSDAEEKSRGTNESSEDKWVWEPDHTMTKPFFWNLWKTKQGWNVWGHWEGVMAIEKEVRRFRVLLWAEKQWNHFCMLAANRRENKTSMKSSTQIVWVVGGKPTQTASNIQRRNMGWELSRQYSRISLCNWWRYCCQGLKAVFMFKH